MKITERGIDDAMKRLVAMDDGARRAYVEGVTLQAEHIMTDSQVEVPVDTGRLKNSKFLTVEKRRDGCSVTMGYRANYATEVHELPPTVVEHKVGKWKFLEDPVKRAQPGFNERVAEHVVNALERHGK